MALPDPQVAKADIAAVEDALKAGYAPQGAAGGNKPAAIAIAAKARKISRQTFDGRISRTYPYHWDRNTSHKNWSKSWRELVGQREPDWSLYKPPTEQDDIDDVPIGPSEKQRLTDRIRNLENELRGYRRQEHADDDLRQAVYGLAAAEVTPPTWTIREKKSDHGPGVPLLFASDFQWGETIDQDELQGVNAFNVEIAQRRYRRLIERTIDLSFRHMVNPTYPGMFYLRGGDMVSGDIHEDLRETNELAAIPATMDLVAEETAGIRHLADAFGKVRVISVPGNHGRTTRKPQSKRYARHSYDTQTALMLEALFKDDKRVSFYTPMSGDALFPVYGWNFLMTHGDRIGSRGGFGFVGPSAAISRGMKKLQDYYARLGHIVHYILVGHFHDLLELEWGFSNGSLPGVSEYARDGRFTPRPPAQWLLFVHPEYGVTCRWPIMLEKQGRPTEGEPL